MNRRLAGFLILSLLSIGAVGVILHYVGFDKTVTALGEAGVRAILGIICVSLLWLMFQTLAWDRLSRPVGHRVPLRTLFGGIFVGFVGSYLTPSMYVGGEPLRVAYVGHKRHLPYYQVAGTVLLAKYLEFIAFVLLVCGGTVVALVYYWDALADPAFSWVRGAMGFGAAVLLSVLVLLIVALRGRHHPINAVVRWLIRRGLFARFLRRRRQRIRQMEDQIARTFNREGASAWAAFGLLCAGMGMIFLRPLVFFYFLKDESTIFTFPELCLIFTMTQFVVAIQVTPGSLGSYEAGTIGIFAILERGDHLALAYVMGLRIAEGLLLLAGMVFAARQGIKIISTDAAPKADPDDGTDGEQ